MRILDDHAAIGLMVAVARQAHRDAQGLDSATPEERLEARRWLAHWQGVDCEAVTARVQPVKSEYAKGRTRRKPGRKGGKVNGAQ